MSLTLKEVTEKLNVLHAANEKAVKENMKEDGSHTFDSGGLKAIDDRNAEIMTLTTERGQLLSIEGALKAAREHSDEQNAPNHRHRFSNDGGDGGRKAADEQGDYRSIGQRFVDSDGYSAYTKGSRDTRLAPLVTALDQMGHGSIKSWQLGAAQGGDGGMKATMTTSAGFAPFIPRVGTIIPMGQIMPVIADLIPSDPTDVPGSKYMEETTYTNNAATVAEGASKPEAAMAYTERTVNMAKIAQTLPVTDEQLSDVPQIRGLIDNRMGLMIRQAEDNYLLNAAASPDGFDGFLVKSGVQTTTHGAEPLSTAVLRMMTKIQFSPGFAAVTGLVMNPLDWLIWAEYQTTIGSYLVGSSTDDPITRMWGQPIIRTNRIAQGTCLLGDFQRYAHILRREELRIDVGWANDDFLKNLQRIRAEERMVLEIYRPAAFATITGIHA